MAMSSTVLYRPHTDEETIGLIAETLDVLLDSRTDGIIHGPLQEWGLGPPESSQLDVNTLRTTLRHLLPHNGFGESSFRICYGWTRDEIAKIVVLLRMSAKALRGSAPCAILSGTALTLTRDADKIDRLVERWSGTEVGHGPV